MITRFRVQNYKALRDVTLDLTPIHVLIGPNDSGKTSILEALAALSRSVDSPSVAEAFATAWSAHELVWNAQRELLVHLDADIAVEGDALPYSLSCEFRPASGGRPRLCLVQKERLGTFQLTPPFSTASGIHRAVFGQKEYSEETARWARVAYGALSGVHSYRWVPHDLALPVAYDSSRRFRMEPSGFGLAQCLDDILSHDRDAFTRMESRLKQFFPSVKSITLPRQEGFVAPTQEERRPGKGVSILLTGSGIEVPATQVSDGLLQVLALLAILHLPKVPSLLLIEEPENGIHPQRLDQILDMLRDYVYAQAAPQTQVILTTHAPYAVSLFAPQEVTLCRKLADGSVAVRRLDQSRLVKEQMDVFTLGEIWTGEGDEAISEPIPENQEQEVSK